MARRRTRKNSQSQNQSAADEAGSSATQIATLPVQTQPGTLSFHQDTQIIHGGTLAAYNETEIALQGDTQLLPDDNYFDSRHGDTDGQAQQGNCSIQADDNTLLSNPSAHMFSNRGEQDNKNKADSDATTQEENDLANDFVQDDARSSETFARCEILGDEKTNVDGFSTAGEHFEGGISSNNDAPQAASQVPKPISLAAIRAASLRNSGLHSATRNPRNATSAEQRSLMDNKDGGVKLSDDSEATIEVNPDDSIFMLINDAAMGSKNDHSGRKRDSDATADVNFKLAEPASMEVTNTLQYPVTASQRNNGASVAKDDSVIGSRELKEDSRNNHGVRQASEMPEEDTKEHDVMDEQEHRTKLQDPSQNKVEMNEGKITKQPVNLPAVTNLSYLDSHEPGEETQLAALDVVEKLVWLNNSGSSQDAMKDGPPKQPYIEGMRSSKGLQSLAQTADMKTTQEKMGVYDWVDSQMQESDHLPDAKLEIGSKVRRGRKSQIRCEEDKSFLVTNSAKIGGERKMPIVLPDDTEPHTLMTTRLKESSRKKKVEQTVIPKRKRMVEETAAPKRSGRKRKVEETVAPKRNVRKPSEAVSNLVKGRTGMGRLLKKNLQQAVTVEDGKKLLDIAKKGEASASRVDKREETGGESLLHSKGRKRLKREDASGDSVKAVNECGKKKIAKSPSRRVHNDDTAGSRLKEGLKYEDDVAHMNEKISVEASETSKAATKVINANKDVTQDRSWNDIFSSRTSKNGKQTFLGGDGSSEIKRKDEESDTDASKVVNANIGAGSHKSRTNRQKGTQRTPKMEVDSGILSGATQQETRQPKKKATSRKAKADEGRKESAEIPLKPDFSPVIAEGRRKKRGTSCVWVLLSQNLPEEIKKQQKKLLAKFGGHLVSSVADCSHFVANGFARTQNMLESIASGKPVVTPQWLESCVQAHYLVDEKNYILQDVKKEKELGFSLRSSLAAAQHKQLLQGVNVLVSPNITPNVNLVASIIRSAGGEVLDSVQKFSKLDIADTNFVIANEDDFEFCRSLLEKGFKAYCSELILSGVVVQNLDLSRHQIFQ